MGTTRITRLVVGLFVAALCPVAGAQTATSWAQSKTVDIDFDDDFVRVGSDFAAFSFATGFGTDIAFASPKPELHPITISSFYASSPTAASAIDATSSAEAAWHINKNDFAGTATLTNTVAGAASIAPTAESPDLVAVSWAMQTSSVDLGSPDPDGEIDWSPAITLGSGGGGIVNSSGAFSITDPIVVWVEDLATGIAEPNIVFQFNAEADSLTEMHWNEVATVDAMTGDIVLSSNEGSFLDATHGGTGSFSLALGSDLIPVAQRGTLSVAFENGIITQADATGIFQALAPRQNAPPNTLPAIGSPALIDSLEIGNSGLDGQFSLAIDTGVQRGVSDIAACSEGVHVEIGAGIDSVQTFSVQPSHRDPLEFDASMPMGNERVPRPCFGPIAENAELLFGNQPVADHELTLVATDDSPTIDRFARLSLSQQETHKTLALNRPTIGDANSLPTPNVTPGETRRWNAKVRVRDAGVDNTGIQILAISLVDIGSHGVTTEPGFTIFSNATDAITFTIGRIAGDEGANGQSNELRAQLFIAGIQAETDIPFGVISDEDWNDLELSVEELSGSTRFQLSVVDADTTTTILDTTVDDFQLSDLGYRLAVGSRTIDTAGGHDFDNLVLSYQQNGDLNWDTHIDGNDVTALSEAVEAQRTDSLFDINYDNLVNATDIQFLEDLVPNKLPGDANFDGRVDFPDFLALSEAFGQDTGLWTRGDFDRDGRVDFPDFLILSQNFGVVAEGSEPMSVPEPSTRIELVVAMLALLIQLQMRQTSRS